MCWANEVIHEPTGKVCAARNHLQPGDGPAFATRVVGSGAGEGIGLSGARSHCRMGTPEVHFGLILGGQVTDAGLKELAGLNQLQGRDLGATQLTDEGLRDLAGLTRCRRWTSA